MSLKPDPALPLGVAIARALEQIQAHAAINEMVARMLSERDSACDLKLRQTIVEFLENIRKLANWQSQLWLCTEGADGRKFELAAVGLEFQPCALRYVCEYAREFLVQLAIGVDSSTFQSSLELPNPLDSRYWIPQEIYLPRKAISGFYAASRTVKPISRERIEQQIRREVLSATCLTNMPVLSESTTELLAIMLRDDVTTLHPKPKEDILSSGQVLGWSNTHAFDQGIKLGLFKGQRKVGVGLTPLGEQVARLAQTLSE